MAADQEQPVTFETESLLGENTVSAPTTLTKGQWRRLKNAHQGQSTGSSKQRPGSVPTTATALGVLIKHLTTYKASATPGAAEDIYASSGTTLYKIITGEWSARTMTNALVSSDIYTLPFTDGNLASRLIIADDGHLKEYDDATGIVKDIVAAPDDTAPAPPNDLAAANTAGVKFVWQHMGYIFLSDGAIEIWISKRYLRDYFPSTSGFYLAKNNDYVNGCGVTYNDVCLIPKRKSWSIVTGTSVENFGASQYLNTTAGVIAPRSIQRITYPDGGQTIVYLSDDGVHEIYDTGFQDTGSRRYSTRALMKGNVDFNAIGLTETEKAAAVGFFDADLSLYMLKFNRGTERLVYAYDTRNGQWYPWNNIKANGFVNVENILYYAGETGHLHKFDDSLGSDWNEKVMTTGTPIDWDNITDLIAFEYSGFASILDYILASAKQYGGTSNIDIYLTVYASLEEYLNAIRNQYMVWDESAWDEVVWANLDYTDLVGKPIRINVKKKSYYFQLRFRNNRDELAELYKYRLIARTSGN